MPVLSRLWREKRVKKVKKLQKSRKIFQKGLEIGEKICYTITDPDALKQRVLGEKDNLGGF